MPTNASDAPGFLAPLVYNVVFTLPLLGLGLFCMLYGATMGESKREEAGRHETAEAARRT